MTNRLKRRAFLATTIIVTILVEACALPQTTNFIYRNGFWYDSWGFTRDNAEGTYGFVPNLAYETLGEWRGTGLDWGRQLAAKYSDKNQRAEAILGFVQRWTNYGYDVDNVVIGGVHQEEWAWNGDETASRISFDTNTVAIGDCEDLVFFCSVLYEGAGFDTAIVLTTNHVALLIWLPDYPNVLKWDLEGDGRGFGWIWVESTGKNNPLGWTPSTFRDGDWEAFVIENLYIHDIQFYPEKPTAEDDVTVKASILHKTSNLQAVTLRYSAEGNSHEVEMEHASGEMYQAVIPKQRDGDTVEFEVYVTDSMGYERSFDPTSYQIGKKGFEIPTFISNIGLILVAVVGIIFLLIIL